MKKKTKAQKTRKKLDTKLKIIKCPNCDGKGKVFYDYCDMGCWNGNIDCYHKGWHQCPTCKGKGRIKKQVKRKSK